MLRYITGQPGSAKTQYAIKKAIAEKRPVYYCNIKLTEEGKALGWHEFHFEHWRDCPAGALLLVDECQDFIPATNKEPLEHVRKLAEHRHFGLDIWLITQHPKQTAAYVRRLAGEWLELTRIFGRNASTVKIRNKTEDTAPVFAEELFSYDKNIWALYKSVTVHTKHGRVPFRMVALIAAVVVGIAAVVMFATSTSAFDHTGKKQGERQRELLKAPATAPGLSAPIAPKLATALAQPACAVLTGIVQGKDRAILVFEYADGGSFRESVHLTQLKNDEVKIRDCSYYIGGGSMLTRDSVAREALYSKKSRDVSASVVAATAAPSEQVLTPARSSSSAPVAQVGQDAIVEAINFRNREALRRAVALADEANRSGSVVPPSK